MRQKLKPQPMGGFNRHARRHGLKGFFASVVLALLLASPVLADGITVSFAPIVRKVAPAVVNIFAKRVVRERTASPFMNDPLFRQFFGNTLQAAGPVREKVQRSLGSGVIIGADGTIVTSNHVVAGAEAISVVLADRREFEAKVVKRDPQSDLAFLHIDAHDLPYLEMRDSDTLEVGDVVLAIGNPFGIGQTVTHGIISALARPAQGVSDYQFFIQTDAPINPGNSGGALVDMQGRLIGINTAIYSTSGGSNGIGFAIPSNMVKAVQASEVKGGKVVRPWFGLTVQPVTQEVADAIGLKTPYGALVNKVASGGPADKAGIRAGDVITQVGGAQVTDDRNLIFRMETAPIGSKVELTLLRAGAKKNVTLVPEAPKEIKLETLTISGKNPLKGLVVATLTPGIAEELGMQGAVAQGGVVVAGGESEGGIVLQKGDIISSVNGKAMVTAKQLQQALDSARHSWSVTVLRGSSTLKLTVQK